MDIFERYKIRNNNNNITLNEVRNSIDKYIKDIKNEIDERIEGNCFERILYSYVYNENTKQIDVIHGSGKKITSYDFEQTGPVTGSIGSGSALRGKKFNKCLLYKTGSRFYARFSLGNTNSVISSSKLNRAFLIINSYSEKRYELILYPVKDNTTGH